MPELETLTTIGFAQLTKYNAKTGEFVGVMTSERPDKDREALDYNRSKPAIRKWSEDAKARSNGKSLGNLREMHTLKAAGRLSALTFDDKNKQVIVRGLVVDPLARTKCEEGVYTGISLGGTYAEALPDPTDPRIVRYVVGSLGEISLVDDPCNPDATFELVGADGGQMVVKFAPRLETIAVDDDDEDPPVIRRKQPLAKAGSNHEDDMPDQTAISDAIKEDRKLRKVARGEKKAKKLAKWSKRAEAHKIDYAKLTKAQRREFRATWRADKALSALEKVYRGNGQTPKT